MRDHERPRADLGALLELVEAASPTDAIEVVADALAAMLGAHTVSGQATIINAGHPLPLRRRNGRVEEVPLDIDLPFGLQPNTSFRIQAISLAPGDRFVFLSDGMLERNATQLDVAATLEHTSELHPREVVHALGAAVLGAPGGDLRDDATVVVLDWYGGPLRRRESTRGASQHHASP